MEKLNVVLLNLTRDKIVSGVNRYLEQLVMELGNYSDIVLHQVTLLQKQGMFYHQITRKQGVIEAVVMLPMNINPIVSGLYWMERYAGVVAELLLPYFRGMPHLIWHTHCINLSQLAVKLKQGAGGIILTHLHCIPWKFSLEQNSKKFDNLYWKYQQGQFESFQKAPLEELTYRVSDRIICVTQSAAHYLTRAMHIPAEKISVVYNGAVDVGVPERSEEEKQEPQILFVGRISKEKGVSDLLAALEQLWKQGYRFRLTLAGNGNKTYIRSLREKYACLNPVFKGCIDFEELKTLYARCTLGVIPSLHEQCSYAAIEMMMFGIPLVVTDVDGLGEIFTHGCNALKVTCLFDREKGFRLDSGSLKQALAALMEQPDLRVRLGRQARRLYEDKFRSCRMGEETVGIYRKIAKETEMEKRAPEKDVPAEITVVFPYRNAGHAVGRILSELVRYVKCRYHLLLIDDASDDGFDYEKLVAGNRNISYVRHEQQRGLPGCWDEGVMRADTEFVFLLDQQVWIYEDFLSPVLAYCRQHPRSLVCVQNRLYTVGQGNSLYRLATPPLCRGGRVDFSGIRGPLALVWDFQDSREEDAEVVRVPCVRGYAYAIRREYYLYLHGMNGMLGEGFEDAFLSAKVWLEGGSCVLFRGKDIGRYYPPSRGWHEPKPGQAYEKILYARLLMGKWGEAIERMVKRHYSQGTLECINKNVNAVAFQIGQEREYLSGIFNHTVEELLYLNRCDGSRIYTQ